MSGAGKGDRYRPVNQKRYDAEYDRIFGDPIKRAAASFEKDRKIGKFNGRSRSWKKESCQ